MAISKLVVFLLVTTLHVVVTQSSTPVQMGREPPITLCNGGQVKVPWGNRKYGYTVMKTNWIFQPIDGSREVMVTNPEYQQITSWLSPFNRVEIMNDGVILSNLTQADSGKYTERTWLRGVGSETVTIHDDTTGLMVVRGMRLKGDKLRAHVATVWDEATERWVLKASCGLFASTSPRPAHVVWDLPNGTTTTSEDYRGGSFYLTLTSPVQEGNYTCRLPQNFIPRKCVRRTSSAATAVVGTKDRLTLLEAQRKTDDNENRELRDEVETLKKETKKLRDELETLKNKDKVASASFNDRS